MRVRSFLLRFALLLVISSQPTLGAVTAKDINATATAFLASHSKELARQYGDSARLEYKINQLDSRLSMQDCPQPLVAELKSNRPLGRITLKISCQQSSRWSLYVSAEINLYRPVVSAVMPVAKGTVLNASQLHLQELDISKLTGSYFTAIDQVVGMQARRSLTTERPITAEQLEQAIVIRRGDAVLMSANTGSLMVKIPGIALADGHKGQQISVKNSQSKRVVQARVVASGQVMVAM